jgi:hypothetical protein
VHERRAQVRRRLIWRHGVTTTGRGR